MTGTQSFWLSVALQQDDDCYSPHLSTVFCCVHVVQYESLLSCYIQVLAELKEYATEVDVDFVRKAVRAIGRCAIKVEVRNACMQVLSNVKNKWYAPKRSDNYEQSGVISYISGYSYICPQETVTC